MIDEIIDKNSNEPGFFKNNDYQIVEIKECESVTLKAILSDKSMNPYGVAHGGLIFGLGDTAMGIVARTTGRSAVTLNATINYLKPAQGEYIIAKSEIIKNGKTTCYLKCNIYNDKDNLVAVMDANYFYIN